MFNRRSFLSIGAISSLGLTCTDLIEAGINPKDERAVIWVYLGGGASFVDTFNPLPDSTFPEYRSVTGFVDTNVAGLKFAGQFEKLATIADRLTVVKSFSHTNPDHSFGTHLVQTGMENRQGGQSHPSIGSMVSAINGGVSENGLPYYTKTNSVEHDGPAWLGAAFGPFDVNSDAKKNFLPSVEHERLKLRANLLAHLDRFQPEAPQVKNMNALKNQAYSVLFGQAREAFEISKESQKVRDLYGPGLGANLLAARRLVQYGSKFVQVSLGGFDNHANIKPAIEKNGETLDRGLFSLLTDLATLGLTEKVMVVVTSEFSRTKVNAMAGRDHNPRSCPLVIAGGKFSHCGEIGKTDKNGLAVENEPTHPRDLVATIFKHFDIPANTQRTNHQGRPIYLIDKGHSIL